MAKRTTLKIIISESVSLCIFVTVKARDFRKLGHGNNIIVMY